MDYFRYIIKRILYKFPLKLLLIIAIVLLLSFVIIGIDYNVKAFASEYDLSVYTNYLSSNTWFMGYDSSHDNYYLVTSLNNNTNFCGWAVSYNSTSQIYSLSYGEVYNWFTLNGNINQGRSAYRVYQYVPSNNTFNLIGTYQNNDSTRWTCPGMQLMASSVNVYARNPNNAEYINSSSYFPTTAYTYEPLFTNPYFVTSNTDITSWSFDNLVINLGSVNLYDTSNNLNNFSLSIEYTTTYNSFDYSIDLMNYLDINNLTITIPKQDLLTNYVVDSFDLDFTLAVRGVGVANLYSLGDYAITLATGQSEVINGQLQIDTINDSVNQVNTSINNMNNNINNVNNNLNTINDSLTSSDYNATALENKFSGFGEGMILTDNTHLEQLFVILYNAFCNNSVIDLTFTIPFVNKQVTINSSNISAYYPQQLTSIVALFVWGMIGLYIIKDIRGMINKVAEGNVENVSSDVKKEVL